MSRGEGTRPVGSYLKASKRPGSHRTVEGLMGRVVLYMFMTADGFIAGPQGEFDSYEPSSAEQEMANEFFRGADAIMLTYSTRASARTKSCPVWRTAR